MIHAYCSAHRVNEPQHIHVDRDDNSAKFWLAPVALARNLGYTARELRDVERMIQDHQRELLDAWDEFFGH